MSKLKQTTFSGHVENNVIVLDDHVELPEGIRVIITVPEPETKSFSGLCGI